MTFRDSLVQSLSPLRSFLKSDTPGKNDIVQKAWSSNPWFIPEFTYLAMDAVADEFLDENRFHAWLAAYPVPAVQKNISLILAGNVPLVGFHDLLCVLASGHNAVIKLSDKDPYLLPFITDQWIKINPSLSTRIQYVDTLDGFDAVIATGSNNSSRYFEFYFRNCPHILRRNRNGIAVLTGTESKDELKGLARDIFLYFGLGCRNVSKVFVPEGYDFNIWREAIEEWEFLQDHHKYKNNLDYNYAIYIINRTPHIHLGHLIVKEDEAIASRIGCVHYTRYTDRKVLESELRKHKEELQCIISSQPIEGWEHIRFGHGQQPELNQYADGVDTMHFLTTL